MAAPILTAREIAQYFLANVDEEGGDNITNLKLQKLLYYAQGFHLAMHDGEPLFQESILAWKHGPVVRSIYSQYKHLKFRPIARPSKYQVDNYPPEIRELLNAVNSNYGQFTATKLKSMTHDEPPWSNTPRNRVITRCSLKEFFSTIVAAGQDGRSVPGEPVWPANSFRFQGRRAISERMAVHRDRLGAIARRVPVGTGRPWDDN
jgi:uncharacterized phage-associated protein